MQRLALPTDNGKETRTNTREQLIPHLNQDQRRTKREKNRDEPRCSARSNQWKTVPQRREKIEDEGLSTRHRVILPQSDRAVKERVHSPDEHSIDTRKDEGSSQFGSNVDERSPRGMSNPENCSSRSDNRSLDTVVQDEGAEFDRGDLFHSL